LNDSMRVSLGNEKGEIHEMNRILHIAPDRISLLLASIVDRCLAFLNETIKELQYGGVAEFLMEEIRRNTDERLATFDKKITEETQSLYLNLTSTNPADWSKVGHSCRKILKFLADSISPSDDKYEGKDGRFLNVNESCYINRLQAYIDETCSPDERNSLVCRLNILSLTSDR